MDKADPGEDGFTADWVSRASIPAVSLAFSGSISDIQVLALWL